MIQALTDTLKYRWKVFLLSMAAQFIIVGALNIGLHPPKALDFLLVNKATVEKVDTFDQVKTKLEQKTHEYKLQKSLNIVNQAFAGGSYDQARSFIAVDFNSGQILADYNAEKMVPIASLTKIMTSVVALDLALPNDLFVVSKRAADQIPTKIGVVAGQKMSLDELLHASLMTSANDATVVIEEGIDSQYGKGTFVRAMNAKADILGLKNTHFENPAGFDGQNHYSSAADLALLSHYALTNYPQIAEITEQDYIYLPPSALHKQFDLYNWNGLLGVYPGTKGIKIGNTDDAGYTTAVVSERSGQKIMTVLLGAPGVAERDLWTAQLLDDSFAKLGIPAANITKAQLQAKYDSWQYWN